MLAALEHRGPDGSGVAGRGQGAIGLARLAIIDVDASAAPFSNDEETVFCVCNGQIYNSQELRSEFAGKGYRFRSEVDTEVILPLYLEHGIEGVRRLDGMFAFAIWDSRTETLVLGRDRAGEKPMFYWTDGHEFLFGSEIRALLSQPQVELCLDPQALTRYLSLGYFPAPWTPIHRVHKLPAAHVLVFHQGKVTLDRYWDLASYFPMPGSTDRRSSREIAEELDDKLKTAVRRRSRSHVPFGVLLSGGIDSSALLAYLTDIHGPGIPAFTLGQTDLAFDESKLAAKTAQSLQADARQLIVSRQDLEQALRSMGNRMDEPLGDASMLPTMLLAQFARQSVKVVLSGEGADEMFGGYPTYLGHRVADRFAALPAPLRNGLISTARRLLPVSMGNVGPDYLLERFASAIDRDPIERHQVWFGSMDPRGLDAFLSPAMAEVAGGFRLSSEGIPVDRLPDPLAVLLFTDFTQYLQDNLLTKVDRASMLASLEARAAFLDNELVEFVAGIPSKHKVRGLTTKKIFRQTVRARLPADVLRRRKRGFNIPFSKWVLGGLGRELRQRFSEERVETRGLFNFAAIDRLLAEHEASQADHRKPLFALLAFDLWCDRTFGEGAAVPIAQSSSEAPAVTYSPKELQQVAAL